jgi:hypothetical protein
MDQLNADLLFEIPDLPAEGWLGRVQLLLGGNGQTAGIRHGDEVAQMPELHCNPHVSQAWGQLTKSFSGRLAASIAKRQCVRGLPGRQGYSGSEQHESMRMRKGIRASLLFLLVMTGFGGAAAQSPSNQPRASGMEADLTKIKQGMLGSWESIAPEVRPSASKNADGSLKPFYLKRAFKYLPSDRFELEITNSADPYGAVPLARIKIGGHMLWRGPHPIAEGAQKVDFVADESYEVTPLAQGFADVLNKVASDGYSAWAVNTPQSVFGKSFVPFGLKVGTNFMEYDLVYLRGDMLFWGARNIDGRAYDTEQNRPTNLQIPLIRK